MTVLQAALHAGPICLLLLMFTFWADGQNFGEQCLAKYKQGRVNFILDADGSVKDGATFLSSPKVGRYKDCVLSCCKDSKCNVAFMERGAEDGLIKSCFLFDCLYNMKYVCRFVGKVGYFNYFLNSVYESDLAVESNPSLEDNPPVANGGSARVVQPQDGVTLNGIESHDDNGIETFQWQLVTGNPYAVIEKTPYKDAISVSNLTSGIYKFRLTVVDTIGQSDSTIVTVLVLNPEQSKDHCMSPVKVGPCRGHFPRWQYNGASQRCEEFIYGGCRGNLNNYLNRDECTNACEGSDGGSKASRGLPIPSSLPKGEKCGVPCSEDEFTCANGCCLEAGLDCDKVEQCSDGSDEKNCENLKDKFETLLQIPVDEKKARCTESPVTGDCRNSFTRWYYNPVLRSCAAFNYGGCRGNENRFVSKEECMHMCDSVTEVDIFARKESFEGYIGEAHTGVLAVAVLLGIAILALLVVLGYCFLKGKKKTVKHQRVANGTQAFPLEDTDKLVYNSTTKPI
ncbi:kunitz-type protease inhibitor 1a [Gadus macrocephalus]|uniref:kunitz-type protease inhibitor 1a n=1 Tax=Gadus macrocephalus TaxID=80720 RepID=UPI0028CB3913|nr:kunitz-type protease inhibitor 1a [Gadus macrocephalus]